MIYNMRMAKRFGLVLMVLALLVSFAGSATAAVSEDRSLDIRVGYKNLSGIVSAEILPVQFGITAAQANIIRISEDFKAYSSDIPATTVGYSLFSVSIDIHASNDQFVPDSGLFGLVRTGLRTLDAAGLIVSDYDGSTGAGRSVDIFSDLVWDETGGANKFTINWDNVNVNSGTSLPPSYFYVKLVSKRALLSDFVIKTSDLAGFANGKYQNSKIEVTGMSAVIDIPWSAAQDFLGFQNASVYESDSVNPGDKAKAQGATLSVPSLPDNTTGTHQINVTAEDRKNQKTYSVKFRDPYNTKDLGLFVISNAAVAGSPIPITVTGVDSATAHGKYVPDTVLKETFFLPLSDDYKNSDYAWVTGVEHISNTETYRVNVQDEGLTVPRTFILSFDGSTPAPTPDVKQTADLNLFDLTIHAQPWTSWTANAAAGTATVTNWGTNGVLNPIPNAADVAFRAKAATKSTVSAVTAGTAVNTLSVTVTGEDATVKTYVISFTPASAPTPVDPTGGGSSGGGCDAGLGAFGLIILAGSAMVLRKKK
ncbi:hypothetical protein FACS1894167_04020 [Synergistales bacterium]|nr:hypothetical protein FACS1894167_04020 [Synergistales bacterium]